MYALIRCLLASFPRFVSTLCKHLHKSKKEARAAVSGPGSRAAESSCAAESSIYLQLQLYFHVVVCSVDSGFRVLMSFVQVDFNSI